MRKRMHKTVVALIVVLLTVALLPARGLGQVYSKSKPKTFKSQNADVKRLRKLLRKDPSTPASCEIRIALTKALISLGAPARELVEAAGITFCGPDPQFYYQLAKALNQPGGEYLAYALQYAAWAYRRYLNDGMNIDPSSLIVSIRIKRGEFDWVIRRFSKAARWDTYSFAWLGFAYEKSNMIDEAIDAYIQAAGARAVFPRGFSYGIVELPNSDLQALYQKRFGTLDGLSERLEAAGRAAWQSIHVDPYRIENPPFGWMLRDLVWRPVFLSDYKDKIVVLCFMPTDYQPALEELKRFQQASERYKDSGVIFLVVDVEHRITEPETRRVKVPEALKRAGITLPALLEYSDNVRRLFYQTGWTAGVILIDRNHERAFRGSIFHDGQEKLFKVLDYLIEESRMKKITLRSEP